MKFEFKSKKLEDLYYTEKNARKYPSGVVDAFFEVMGIISAAQDERDLYALKGLYYKKLKGSRCHQKSIRLNNQYRLILEIHRDDTDNMILIIDIEDYH
ncbi:MAG: type II toxin-antitoxin system RelE/ParE family toxin [Anaerolineales bacterium]|nr:type II toxin-antitoxin system RelE/ParE family toxin [Anaerolineales bacterium]